jgi:DNA polymerase III delta prime subunit
VDLRDVTARDIDIHDVKIIYTLPDIEVQEHRKLLILLGKVKHFWIEGVLNRSVPVRPPLDLDKEALPDVVKNPWEKVVGLPDTRSQFPGSNKRILDIFDELGRALLILGVPGSGKTITLLELARDLIARAEGDPSQSCPVVINLSTWNRPRETLFDWLIDEIRDKYQIPAKFTRTWLEENRLSLLLDGLDEVRPVNRSACVKAINTFARDCGLPGVVVTSRLEEYSQLPVRLELHGAILLKPLTDSQISLYLARAGSKLAALQAALQDDPVLKNQAQFPLMLSIMSMAYSLAPQGLPVQALAGQESDDIETRRRYLFETYIDAMLTRKGTAPQSYPRQKTLSWLSWLARRMTQHGQTVFLIEGMQPDWLPSRRQRSCYLLSFSLIFGFLASLIHILGWYAWGKLSPDVAKPLADRIGLSVWVVGCVAWAISIGIIDLVIYKPRAGAVPVRARKTLVVRQVIVNILTYGFAWVAIWAVLGCVADLWEGVDLPYKGPPPAYCCKSALVLPAITGAIGVVLVGMVGGLRSFAWDIRTAEAVGWSWSGAWKGSLCGALGSMLIWCLWLLYWPCPRSTFEPKVISDPRLVFLLVCLIVGAETGALALGIHYRILERKTVPNQGIALSMKNVLEVGPLCWAIYALTMWGLLAVFVPQNTLLGPQWNFEGGDSKGEVFSVFLGMSFFSISALLLGGVDVLKHYVLRGVLYLTGQTPGKYASFLNYASRLNFLQRVGGGYIFIHRLLLEHFAAMTEMGKDKSTKQRWGELTW